MAGERVVRRLAAILAADVAGYSRLMGRDEDGTLARLKAHRTERLEPILARHGGRLVKLTGDGALVEFASAVDALGAAIEFQQAMADANRNQPEDTRIVFRVGLHLGDLIVDGDDLYGDGVNVAARLEAETPPGGIVISGDVHNAVAGKLKATFDDLGSLALKNIDRPVQAFAVKWLASDWPLPAASTASAIPTPGGAPLSLPDKPSIAVLPFQNMSGDPEQEYFADGMAEDIITALSRFRSLFVIARNSSFTYKGRAVDLRKGGSELGVRYVLEGSVRKAGNRLRITGQLIDCGTGRHLWADRFDGALEDVFSLQDSITEKVIGALAPRVQQAEIERTRHKPSGNLSAYDYYLRGLASQQKLTKDGITEAIAMFRRAIDLDPEHSSALGMLLWCYGNLGAFGMVGDAEAERAEVTSLIQTVVRVGRDDALALSQATGAIAFLQRDLSTAKSLVDQALTLNPNLANAWTNSGWINLWLGDATTANEHLARAIRLDPLHVTSTQRSAMAHICFYLDRYADALEWAESWLQENAEAHPALRIGTASAAFAGRTDVALRMAARLRTVDPDFRLSRLERYLGPYQRQEFLEKQRTGLRMAGLPE